MAHQITAFSLPKIGEADSTNQDRFASSVDGSLIALADGAGSSLYPGQWAELLVKAFCQSADNPIAAIRQSEQEWLKLSQEQWRQYYLEKLQSPNRKWWQGGSQLKACGFSTFLGLRLDRAQGQWQAVAVGDSCLFKLEKQTNQLFVFPYKTAQAFKRTSQCFASLPEYPSFSPQFVEGQYQAGDIFLLATDALSHRLLSDYEQKGEDWQTWFGLTAGNDFSGAIANLRAKQMIQNDDVTMVLVTGCQDSHPIPAQNNQTLEPPAKSKSTRKKSITTRVGQE
jgi:hypothetical protein